MRMACGIAYEGSHYAGWQWQKNVITLQEVVEAAFSKVATHPVRVMCAGRTDQGVHARSQVIHFDTTTHRLPEIWVSACNYYLPSDVRVIWAQQVPDAFHARFVAYERAYRYLIYQGAMPWFRTHALMYPRTLNIAAIQEAGHYLIGEHDFSAFRSADCQARSPIRQVKILSVHHNKEWIAIDITANAFLHHMVRNIVGVLVEVGQGRRAADTIPSLLASRDRRQAGITAAPQGLYLQRVAYPEQWQLPQVAVDPADIGCML